MNLFAIPLLITVVFMSGCGGSKYPSTMGPVTYSVQIQTILVKYCTECHASTLKGAARQGASPDDNYDTYEGAKNDAAAENDSIQNRTMPESAPFPTTQEKADFQAWVDQHMPE